MGLHFNLIILEACLIQNIFDYKTKNARLLIKGVMVIYKAFSVFNTLNLETVRGCKIDGINKICINSQFRFLILYIRMFPFLFGPCLCIRHFRHQDGTPTRKLFADICDPSHLLLQSSIMGIFFVFLECLV